jgi:hypothetical protein
VNKIYKLYSLEDK